MNKNITLIYKVLADGSEKKTGERTDLVECNRFGYGATYAELLPAAKANREKYRSYINEILRITNGYRAEGGVAPLELDEELTIMSCARAEEMAWSGDHDHYRRAVNTSPRYSGTRATPPVRSAKISAGASRPPRLSALRGRIPKLTMRI